MRRAHDVFHFSKPKPYHRWEGDARAICVVIDADGNGERFKAKVLDKLRFRRKVQYILESIGDPVSEAAW